MFNLIKLRDNFWNYPNALFFGKTSVLGRLTYLYLSSRPFSHIIATVSISLLVFATILSQLEIVLGFNSETYVEGVIVGLDNSGNLRKPQSLNPLGINSVQTQLQNDIISLVYQPLFQVDYAPNDFNPKIVPILAENFSQRTSGTDTYYRFNLRKDVYWHDGKAFTADDVVATFNLIKELASSDIPNIYGANIAQRVTIEKLDDHICEFKLSGTTIPNFYELISFKVLSVDSVPTLKESLFDTQYKGNFKLNAIGTGPYQLSEIRSKDIVLKSFANYYLGEPKIKEMKLYLLADVEEAIAAVQSGLVHGVTKIDSEAIAKLSDQSNFALVNSPVVFTQYWGLYFNLSATGPAQLKDANVRRAMNLAIDKEVAVKSAFADSEVANSSIPRVSPYFNPAAAQPSFNLQSAEQLLNESGWLVTSSQDVQGNSIKVRKKGDLELRFNLVFTDNPDRLKIVGAIQKDLANLGIILNLEARQPGELSNIRANYQFHLLLFGVSTFIDPDRYEFFHSDQAFKESDPSGSASGLNIADYKSSDIDSDIDTGTRTVIRIPAADKLLAEGRLETDVNKRKKIYDRFQKLLADDVPVIFLYHPSIHYLVNKRVKNINLTGAQYLEERFNNVNNWQIIYD